MSETEERKALGATREELVEFIRQQPGLEDEIISCHRAKVAELEKKWRTRIRDEAPEDHAVLLNAWYIQVLRAAYRDGLDTGDWAADQFEDRYLEGDSPRDGMYRAFGQDWG